MKFEYSSFRKIWIENSLEQELQWQMKENAAALKHGIRNPESGNGNGNGNGNGIRNTESVKEGSKRST